MRLAAAIGAFILVLDAVALTIALICADPSTRGWVLPLVLAAIASAGLVGAGAAAVYAWRQWGDDTPHWTKRGHPMDEGDPVGDFLWGLLVVAGFFVLCVIVLGGSS